MQVCLIMVEGQCRLTMNDLLLADLQCSRANFVAEETEPPINESRPRIVPLEVKPASQEHIPADLNLRDALNDPEQKKYAVRPATQLLGDMVRSKAFPASFPWALNFLEGPFAVQCKPHMKLACFDFSGTGTIVLPCYHCLHKVAELGTYG